MFVRFCPPLLLSVCPSPSCVPGSRVARRTLSAPVLSGRPFPPLAPRPFLPGHTLRFLPCGAVYTGKRAASAPLLRLRLLRPGPSVVPNEFSVVSSVSAAPRSPRSAAQHGGQGREAQQGEAGRCPSEACPSAAPSSGDPLLTLALRGRLRPSRAGWPQQAAVSRQRGCRVSGGSGGSGRAADCVEPRHS